MTQLRDNTNSGCRFGRPKGRFKEMTRITGSILVAAAALILAAGTSRAAEIKPAANQLLNSDCVKCHPTEVQDVAARGAAHKTQVSCLECHAEHPPQGKNSIPRCSRCHDPGEKAHYQGGREIANCTKCHHPHSPLEISFAGAGVEVNPVCVSCHDQQGEELKDYPSQHSQLSCAECHPQHATFKECLECHEPHSQTMTFNDCLRCHKPHMPTVVRYDEKTPSSLCASCHEKEDRMLAANRSKHHALVCAFCHKNQHKLIPECVTCHGKPHGSDLHRKFPKCLTCHQDAHDLLVE